jgi:hypothetical protein
LALEILTGACATLPDPEFDVAPEEGEDDMDGDGEILIFIMFYQNSYNLRLDVDPDAPPADVDMDEEPKRVIAPTTPSLSSLVSPLLALIYPTSLSFPPLAAPSVHPPTTSVLSAIHISALECLNNIFLSLSTSPNPSISTDVDGGLKVWNSIWSALEIVGTEGGLGQERRQEIWEIAVGVLWGVGSTWKGSLVSSVACPIRSLKFCCRYQRQIKSMSSSSCALPPLIQRSGSSVSELSSASHNILAPSRAIKSVSTQACVYHTHLLLLSLGHFNSSALHAPFRNVRSTCWDRTSYTGCLGTSRYIL